MSEREVRESIESFRFEPDQWLWCLHCERFFQGRDARPDGLGGVQACAFEDCDGAGYQVDVFDWDTWPDADPVRLARWPAEGDLVKGLRASAWDDPDGDEAPPFCSCIFRDPDFVTNRDFRTRDVILGIRSDKRPDAPAAFAELDLVGLAGLVREGFVAPWQRNGAGPCTSEYLLILAGYPEATVFGRATHPSRGDYGVVIEGIECDLAGASLARRELLADGLAIACDVGAGGEFEESGTFLRVRWPAGDPPRGH